MEFLIGGRIAYGKRFTNAGLGELSEPLVDA
jgi:hypothetical protein